MRSHKRLIGFVVSVILATGLGGCGSSSDKTSGGASMDELAGAVDAQNAAQKQRDEAAARKAQEEQAAATASQPAEPERKVAGRAPVGEGGYYTAIVGARRHILNKVDDLAWIQGVQHFQATEGRLPKDHDEFMKKIIEPLGINLGYKEPDQEFLYDPHEGQWGEVYVVEKEPAKK